MDKPDYEIEQFWFGFKNSMKNFYNASNTYGRPIKLWSNNLNNLQKMEKYDLIEKNIRNYISLYGIDVMRTGEIYHLNILKTNVKRWNKISKHFNFIKVENKKYYNIIFLIIDIYDTLYYKFSKSEMINFSSEIELLIIYEDFNYLIDSCIKYNLQSIIDKVSEYVNINDLINEKFNLNLKYKTSGRKIFDMINNKNINN